MELWIRSQDKEQLRKIVDLKYQYGTIETNNIDVIVGTTQYDEWEVLGCYATKERALEVLDEIQKVIKSEHIILPTSNYGDINNSHFDIVHKVYEMPK